MIRKTRLSFVWVLFLAAFLSFRPAPAVEPVNEQLIPESRRVLDYLHSIYGNKTLAGQEERLRAEKAYQICGLYPAIVSLDLASFTTYEGKRWTPEHRAVLQEQIDHAKDWHRRGGIVTMQWHWTNPLSSQAHVRAIRPKFMAIDVGKVVTPGTDEHKAAMEDMKRHADYLAQLAEARVPVLFRPFHEIDGGWFWWSDVDEPENTAALWRMTYRYLVEERGLHNLIWVYSAALKAGSKGKQVEAIDYRKRFYPGDEFVDISGIDIYINDWFGWPSYRESSYQKAYDIMRRVTPNKILALCECQGIPNPNLIRDEAPRWLYCLPWSVSEEGSTWNGADWVRETYPHEIIVTLDELPVLVSHNVPPNISLTAPPDGNEMAAGTIEIFAEAEDRDGEVATVSFRTLPGWHTWYELDEEEQAAVLDRSTRLGKVASAPWKHTWKDVAPGRYTVFAIATDDKGATAVSNTARITAGLENLAAGKTVEASSGQDAAENAVDGRLWSDWPSDKDDTSPWIAVDLEKPRKVGAVERHPLGDLALMVGHWQGGQGLERGEDLGDRRSRELVDRELFAEMRVIDQVGRDRGSGILILGTEREWNRQANDRGK